MSKLTERPKRKKIQDIRLAKEKSKKLSMVTCYDAAFARLVDRTEIDIVLVGDSLGNVMMGYDDTIQVRLEDMIHHSAAVARVLERPFLCVDMPFMSYHISLAQTLQNASRLMQQGRAQALKLEGGLEIVKTIRALISSGIPVMGHLGLTPQSLHALGGYRVQARDAVARKKLLADAKALEDSGVFAIVLELIPGDLAQEVTESLSVPTIGIGAGPACDGQVLVLQDLLGFDDGFCPKFLKKYLNMAEIVPAALSAFDQDVKTGKFPSAENTF